MESTPDPIAKSASSPSATLHQRCLHHRQRITSLIYVNLGQANGGIIRDLSESGVAIQAVSPVRVDQPVHLRFDLAHPRVHVEAAGRVAWADARGQAGVMFQNLEERPRRLIKQWIFTQLLSRALQVSDAGAEFALSAQQEDIAELHFSAAPRAAIRLQPPANSAAPSANGESSDAPLLLPWFPFPISPLVFSRCVDGAILFAAVLLFSVLGVLMIETVPQWPVAISLLLAAASLFALTYWCLFAAWRGETPGAHLARIAGKNGAVEEEVDRPRFR